MMLIDKIPKDIKGEIVILIMRELESNSSKKVKRNNIRSILGEFEEYIKDKQRDYIRRLQTDSESFNIIKRLLK